MVKRKQVKPGQPADVVSPGSAVASDMPVKQSEKPRYAVSTKDGYRVPSLWSQPKAYLRSLWDLYEATFAISMLETVSRRIVPVRNNSGPD